MHEDERLAAFLDEVCGPLFWPPYRRRVRRELGFTVNVGIAPNRLLAKMASDFQKPDKVHTLYLYEVEKKMWPLPVGELFGVGPSAAKKLNSCGIYTIGNLAAQDRWFRCSGRAAIRCGTTPTAARPIL